MTNLRKEFNNKEELEEAERRKVLFTYGMSDDAIIIITDAPIKAIKEWCFHHVKELEDGKNTFLDSLKRKYYVRLLFDSEESNDSEDIEIIGYDEVYDFSDYNEKNREIYYSGREVISMTVKDCETNQMKKMIVLAEL